MHELANLKRKVDEYKEILGNTAVYRESWKSSLRDEIISQLENNIKETGLPGAVELKDNVENLEAVVLSLGHAKSGIYEKVNDDIQQHLIKDKGSLLYQQLFNGKIVVIIMYPVIDGYGQPTPPKQIGIYRPEEIKPPFVIRHMEEFIKEITSWEDYDDDDRGVASPAPTIGFHRPITENMISDEVD